MQTGRARSLKRCAHFPTQLCRFPDAEHPSGQQQFAFALSFNFATLLTLPSTSHLNAAGISDDQQSTMNYTRFNYDPLTANQIRVLQLVPGNPICCGLYTKSLKDVHGSFDALSYVWGSDAQLKRIFVNEKPFWIRKNLWKFLRIIRSKIGYLTIWADAICIDQSNLQERAQQVQMMGSIYRAARKVCAWLGEDAGQIGSMARIWNQEFSLARGLHVNDERFQNFCSRLDGGRDFVSEAIHQFLFNEYWTRAWIVPEIILGGDVDVWCRWKSMWEEWECEIIPLPELVMMYLLLGKCFDVKGEGIFSASAKIVDLVHCKQALLQESKRRCETRKVLDLGYLLVQFGSNQCADLRDRVYSLAGLILRRRPDIFSAEMREAHEETHAYNFQKGFCAIIGNYSISCRELFIRVLKIDRPRFVADLAGPLWVALDLYESWLANPVEFASDHFVIELACHRKIHCVQDGYGQIVDNEQKMRLGAFHDPIRNGDILLTFVQNLSLREKDGFFSRERHFGLQSKLFLVTRPVSKQQTTHNLADRGRLNAIDLKAVGVAVALEKSQPGSVEPSRSEIPNLSILEFAAHLFRDTILDQSSRLASPRETCFYATIPLPAMVLLAIGPSADWYWRHRRVASSPGLPLLTFQ